MGPKWPTSDRKDAWTMSKATARRSSISPARSKAACCRGPGAVALPEPQSEPEALTLDPASLKTLLEAMPAAIGILARDGLIHANAAFAYAFGYRSSSRICSRRAGLKRDPADGAPLAQGNGARAQRAGRCADTLAAEAEGRFRADRSIDERPQTASPDRPEEPRRRRRRPPARQRRRARRRMAPARTGASSTPTRRRLDFLAKVSHEVRTPLNSILGFTELMLQERFGPIGNARYKGYVEDIHQSGLYALSLLNDLLDISKIEAGKFELDFTAVEVPELVEDCVNSLQPLAKRSRIVLRTSLRREAAVASSPIRDG